MKLSDLHREFKHFAIFERGMMKRSYKAIWSSMETFSEYTKSQNITDFTENTLRGFLYYGRSEKAWSAKTYRNYWGYFNVFFDWCIRRQYIKKNPVRNIEKPKMDKPLPRCLSREDAKRILWETKCHPWYYHLEQSRNTAIIATLMMTGLRLQEMLNLEIISVSLLNEEIFVHKGKGRKDRIVPIHPKLIPILREYIAEKKKAGMASQWFFTGIKSAKQLSQKDVRRICKKISIASDVKFTPHMLRHTFGREMVDGDLNLFKLKEIMGHAQITTTQRYLSVSQEGIKRSFAKVGMF